MREETAVIQMNPKFALAYVGLALSQVAWARRRRLETPTAAGRPRFEQRIDGVAWLPISPLRGQPDDAVAIQKRSRTTCRTIPVAAAIKLAALASLLRRGTPMPLLRPPIARWRPTAASTSSILPRGRSRDGA
jgi:hypothetical protein